MQIALANRPRIAVFVKNVIRATIDPIRQNTLRARRRKLGLSRVALGRILGVDPATVFRHERGRMDGLWDYALRGIEAEAAEGKTATVQNRPGSANLYPRPTGRSWLVIHCGKNARIATTTRPEKGAPRQTGQKANGHFQRAPAAGIVQRADQADSRPG